MVTGWEIRIKSSSCYVLCSIVVRYRLCSLRFIPDGALNWAKHSRLKREGGKEPDYMGENKEFLVLYTKEYLKSHPNINFFIYGHRHIELDLMLSATARILILGDWINFFSYAVFDGENLFLENYIEGETQL